jgi:uncharacterized membrane protein (DUF4010 family)
LAMMYMRIFILLAIFNKQLFNMMSWGLLALFLISLMTGVFLLLFFHPKPAEDLKLQVHQDKNPLEFKVALLFAVLFLFFTLATHFTVNHFGNRGLTALSLLTGVSDIDPFLISLFQGKYALSLNMLASASFCAIISNNVVKLGYALAFSPKTLRRNLILSLGLIILATVAVAIII